MTVFLTRLLNLFLLAALGLAATRLVGFLREPPPVLPAAPAVESAASFPVAETAQPGLPAATPLRPEAYDVIVARDLFSLTRGVVASAAVVVPPAPKPQPAPKLTLHGVVIVDEEKSAFLQEGTQDVKPKKVRENEPFAGGTVSSIRPDGVTFNFAGAEIAVPLHTPKDTGPAPQAAVHPGVPPIPVMAPVQRPKRQTHPGGMLPATAPTPFSRPPAFNQGARIPVPPTPVDMGSGGEEYYQENPFGEGDAQEPAEDMSEE